MDDKSKQTKPSEKQLYLPCSVDPNHSLSSQKGKPYALKQYLTIIEKWKQKPWGRVSSQWHLTKAE